MAIEALTELRDNLKSRLAADVGSLVRLHERDNVGRGRPGDWLGPIRKSALVLVASNVENFVEDLVCEGLLHLHRSEVVARRYPEGFRLWRFRQSAHMRSLSPEDAKELLNLSLKLNSEVRGLTEGELMLTDLKDGFANPTPRNVNWIMGLLDKREYCDTRGVAVNGTDVRLAAGLGELARRRNEVAHGNAGAEPSIDDVKRLSKFAQMFSTRVMRDVTEAIEACMA